MFQLLNTKSINSFHPYPSVSIHELSQLHQLPPGLAQPLASILWTLPFVLAVVLQADRESRCRAFAPLAIPAAVPSSIELSTPLLTRTTTTWALLPRAATRPRTTSLPWLKPATSSTSWSTTPMAIVLSSLPTSTTRHIISAVPRLFVPRATLLDRIPLDRPAPASHLVLPAV